MASMVERAGLAGGSIAPPEHQPSLAVDSTDVELAIYPFPDLRLQERISTSHRGDSLRVSKFAISLADLIFSHFSCALPSFWISRSFVENIVVFDRSVRDAFLVATPTFHLECYSFCRLETRS